MNLNEILLDLSPAHVQWAKNNSCVVKLLIAGAAASALKNAKAKAERASNLLKPRKRVFYPGASNFLFSEFVRKGMLDPRTRVNRVDGEFAEELLELSDTDIPAVEIVASDILDGGRDTPYPTEPEVRARIGEARIELRLAHICYFLEGADTEPWYMFFCRGRRGALRLVCASWHDGWNLTAVRTGYQDEMRNGGCIVSQDF